MRKKTWLTPKKQNRVVDMASCYEPSFDTPIVAHDEHVIDEVFEGYSDPIGFTPHCRLQRYFINGELVESHRTKLLGTDPRWLPAKESS